MADPVLKVSDLVVNYGSARALQGISLELTRGIVSVIGRNGMGKTTLCNTLVGMKDAASGDIRLNGRSIFALKPYAIQRLGVGYIPQGRRTWPSLSVDEHLRVPNAGTGAVWTRERVYDTFPRLAERRNNGGAALSGGEKQMLAIARALIGSPQLLVMDEPTEGLAPVVVTQVQEMLVKLARDEGVNVLLVEQNFSVATAVSDRVAIMVNGTIEAIVSSAELRTNATMRQELLGVGLRELRDDVALA
ncbi:ABC transporter ATP-binding protein [Phaeobacter italicus]|jgi:ABC-type branched-subunit amino acid transport system ATPase component|uniref:ABC transporter ATP-binding protein n=1 Tax=Phaeobacter italicus TaxID=481446 RepID=UPI002FD9B50B